MLLFATALYCEAAPIIHNLHLKKEPDSRAFDLFVGERAALVITGTGCADAAAGAAYLLARYPADDSSLFVNFGTCGCADTQIAPGTLFLINCIRDATTERVYYPDLLFRSPFHTAAITTLPRVLNREQLSMGFNSIPDHSGSIPLIDLESAALYQAVRHFVRQHQILFCKVVSDHGAEERIAPGDITALLKKPAEALLSWLASLENALSQPSKPFTPEEEACILSASKALHLTEAMKSEFIRLLTYAALTGRQVSMLIAPYLAADFICKNKKEGKQYLDSLKSAFSGADDI